MDSGLVRVSRTQTSRGTVARLIHSFQHTHAIEQWAGRGHGVRIDEDRCFGLANDMACEGTKADCAPRLVLRHSLMRANSQERA